MSVRQTIALLTVGVVWTLGAAGAPAAQDRAPRAERDAGEQLYRTFCASCHGPAGRGDGPVADLSPKPPIDLTVLTRAHGGTFPREAIRTALDGTREVAGHATPAMPNWREVLRRNNRGDERATRAQIEALIDYLESLQQSR